MDRAQALVEETGGRSVEPQIHEERARVAAMRDDADGARRTLQHAYALYVEIGATGHAERLARELAACAPGPATG
ncbi:MAG: hypothetical protein ACE5IL_10620 [Myxococcota bacterium]